MVFRKKEATYCKTQVIVNRETHEIICTAHAEGKKHDFKLYQESIGSSVSENIKGRVTAVIKEF